MTTKKNKFAVGSVVTRAALKKLYGPRVMFVLNREIYEDIPRENKKEHRKVQILKPLPSLEDFQAIEIAKYTHTVDSIISDGYSEFSSLADELRDWHSNLPESFQNGDKGSQLEEAADALESLSEPDAPEGIDKIMCLFLPSPDSNSRADRASEGAAMLRAAIEAIKSMWDGEGPNGEMPSDVDEFCQALEEAADSAENIEFPGMY